jgi:hypothetical protein
MDEGLISLEGYDSGQSYLILEVISNNVVKARDIVPVVVNVAIEPSKAFSVVVGDGVSFRTVRGRKGEEKWVSTNQKILKINAKSGEAISLAEGEV